MRSVRSSGCISGGVPVGGVYLVRGCTWSRGVYLPWGVYLVRGVYLPWGCTWLGGVPAWGGCVPGPGGVYLPGGCTWSGGCTGQVLPPPPHGQTHACKNITFATSLRTVINYNWRCRCNNRNGYPKSSWKNVAVSTICSSLRRSS